MASADKSGTSITLDIASARAFARQALLSGEPELARIVSLSLLQRDPRDPAALLVLSAAESRLGRAKASGKAARAAFRSARDPVLRYESARMAAQAAYFDRRFSLAQFWLRRAAHVAPADKHYHDAVRNFQLVRAQNPWRSYLSFQLTPSSNINRGSSSEVLIIDGQPTAFALSGNAQALSGWVATARTDISYRLPTGAEKTAVDIGTRLYASAHWLSDSAKRQAPGTKGSDFNYYLAEASVRYLVAAKREGDLWNVGLRLGRNWYGGDPLGGYARIETGRSVKLSEATGTRFDYSFEQQWRDADGVPDLQVHILGAQLSHELPWGAALHLSLGYQNVVSDNVNAENTAVLGYARYEFAKPLGPAEVAISVDLAQRDYPVFFGNLFNTTGREDLTWGGTVEFFFPKADVWGFAPTLTVEGSKTDSNVSRHDQEYLGLRLGLRSVF